MRIWCKGSPSGHVTTWGTCTCSSSITLAHCGNRVHSGNLSALGHIREERCGGEGSARRGGSSAITIIISRIPSLPLTKPWTRNLSCDVDWFGRPSLQVHEAECPEMRIEIVDRRKSFRNRRYHYNTMIIVWIHNREALHLQKETMAKGKRQKTNSKRQKGERRKQIGCSETSQLRSKSTQKITCRECSLKQRNKSNQLY